MSAIRAAMVAMRKRDPDGFALDDEDLEWLARAAIASLRGSEAMIMAVQGYREQGVISLYFAEQLVNLAIDAALSEASQPKGGE